MNPPIPSARSSCSRMSPRQLRALSDQVFFFRPVHLFYFLENALSFLYFENCLILNAFICLSPVGMHVQLASGEVNLYLASHVQGEHTYAWVLALEPYAGPPPASVKAKLGKKPAARADTSSACGGSRSSTRRRRSSSSSSRSSQSFEHPVAKLPWFKRRPYSEIRKVRSENILMRLRIAPAFFLHEDGGVDNDGYLLSHGLYNFDLRGKNEVTFSTPV